MAPRGGLAVLRRILRNVARRTRARSRVRVGGRVFQVPRFFVPPIARFDREPWLDDVLAAALRFRRGAFVDVGVNVGQTLLKVASMDPDRQYVGFEPNLSCCFQAERLIEANGLASYVVLPIGLSHEHGVRSLFLRGNHTSSGSVVDGFRPPDFYSRAESVYLACGDAVLRSMDLEAIAVVKLDVEGGELEVLEGMYETLRHHAPIVIFEVLPHFLVMTREHLDDATVDLRTRRLRRLEGLLRGLGYATFLVHDRGALEPVGRIAPGAESDLSRSNYIAVPEEEEAAFVGSLAKVAPASMAAR